MNYSKEFVARTVAFDIVTEAVDRITFLIDTYGAFLPHDTVENIRRAISLLSSTSEELTVPPSQMISQNLCSKP